MPQCNYILVLNRQQSRQHVKCTTTIHSNKVFAPYFTKYKKMDGYCVVLQQVRRLCISTKTTNSTLYTNNKSAHS